MFHKDFTMIFPKNGVVERKLSFAAYDGKFQEIKEMFTSENQQDII